MRTNVSLRTVPLNSGIDKYPPGQKLAPGQMSFKAKIIAAAVVLAFAIIHFFGITRVADATHEPYESSTKTAHMYRAD